MFPCVLIGYPHGRQCYVSLGESSTRHDHVDDYDAATIQYVISSCPGFSGGLVWRPGDTDVVFTASVLPAHLHRGSTKDNPHEGHCTHNYNVI